MLICGVLLGWRVLAATWALKQAGSPTPRFTVTDWHSSAVPKPRGIMAGVVPGLLCKRQYVAKRGGMLGEGYVGSCRIRSMFDLSPVGICSPIDYHARIFVAVRDEWCGETTLPRWECPATTTEGDGRGVTANVLPATRLADLVPASSQPGRPSDFQQLERRGRLWEHRPFAASPNRCRVLAGEHQVLSRTANA